MQRDIEKMKNGALSLEQVLKRVGGTIGIAFGASQVKDFARKVIEVRGEVEKLQISLKTLAGEEAGTKLYEDMRDFVVKTPLLMSTVAQGAQTLLSFNIEASKIMPILKQIGDISMGDAQKFQSLTLAFAQMSSTGKLMGQDLLQMINAGFNPLVVISEQTGKSISQLKDEMAKGAISVEMVENAFRSATEEGGLFHGMLEKQSHGIEGALSNLQGSIEDMFNDIGSKGQDAIVDSIGMATDLVKHYEDVAKVLGVVIAAWGTYRGALLLVAAAQKAMTVLRTAQAFVGLARSVKSASEAMALFNAVSSVNPFVALLGALAGVTTAFFLFRDSEDASAEASRRFGEAIEKETMNVRTLIAVLQNTSKESKVNKDATNELARIAKDYGIVIDDEASKTEELIAKKDELIEKIKEEAVERERANMIAENDETYGAEMESLRKKLEDAFGDSLNKYQKHNLAGMVSDEDIEQLSRLREEQDRLSDALRRGEPVQSQYNEAVRQYTAARRDLIGRLAETAAGMAKEGATAAETERNRLALSNAVKNNTTDIEKLLVSMARETSAYNDSRRAISETALSQSEQIKVQDAARTSADALNTRTQALIDVWNSAHPEMTFKVHFDDSEIPAWMKSMTTEQLKKSLAIRQNFVENNKDGKKRLKIGGDVKDNPKLYGEIGMMQQLVNARETPATPPRVTTPTKGTKKSGSKSESNDVESRKADTIRERLEMADEQAKAEKEAAAKVEAASIASIIEKGERERRERRFQHEETLREIEDQEAEIYKKIYDQRKKEYERNNKGKRYENTAAGGAGWSKETISKTLSEAEKRQVGAATQGLSADRSKEEAEYGRFLKEMRDREEQSMMDYINDHGTTLQKIIAAEKEMAMKMAEADNEWEKKKIRADYEGKVEGIRADELISQIDWVQMFRGVGTMTKTMAEELRTQLRTLAFSDEFTGMDPQLQEKVVSALEGLQEKLGSDPSVNWEQVGQMIQDFMNARTAYDTAKQQESSASEKVEGIKRELGRDDLSKEEREYLGLDLKQAQAELDEYTQRSKDAKDAMTALGQQVNFATSQLENYSNKLSAQLQESELGDLEGASGAAGDFSALGGLFKKAGKIAEEQKSSGQGSGMMSAIASGGSIVDSITNALTGGIGSMVMDMIGIVAKIPQLIMSFAKNLGSMVTGILDGFTEFLKFEWLEDVILSITNSVTSLIQAIFKLPENLGHVVMNIVKEGIGAMIGSIIETMLSAVGLGDYGPSSWFGNGAKIAKEIARLEERNADLIEAMDSLRESFDNSSGAELVANFEKAIEMQQEINANNQKIILNQMRYSGSHSSWAHEWGYLTDEQRAMISRQIGKEFVRKTGSDLSYDTSRYWTDSAAGLAQLTAEEWQIIRGNADVWNRIKSTGDYGGRVAEKIESFIEQAGALEDLTSSLYEHLTNISFDSMFDSFVEKIADMNSEAEDFADDFESYMKKAVIRSMATELFRDKLKAWYEAFADRMGQVDWSKGAQGFSAKVMDELLNGGGTYKDAVTGERKRFESWNSIVEDGLKMRDLIQQVLGFSGEGTEQSGKSGAYSAMSQDQGTKLEGLFVSGQMHWASIDERAEEVVRQMGAASDHLRRIEENTGKSASELKEIKEEIVRIVRDGLKVK